MGWDERDGTAQRLLIFLCVDIVHAQVENGNLGLESEFWCLNLARGFSLEKITRGSRLIPSRI